MTTDAMLWTIRVLTMGACFILIGAGLGALGQAFQFDTLTAIGLDALVLGVMGYVPLSGIYANDGARVEVQDA